MRRADHWLGVTLGGAVFLACSPGAGQAPGGVSDSGGGTTGQGGSGPVLGGGTSGASATGGSAVVTGGTSGGGGTGPVCDELTVSSKPVTPTVLLLVDNSSSMFEPREQLWDALYSALMDPTNGVVQAFQSRIRFGFASYKGIANNGQPVATSETDPACAEIREVPYALDNYQAIDMAYTELGSQWMQGLKWETPTGHAIRRVAEGLAVYEPDPPGPKYILLVTDGNPNTCMVLDPQCGQDQSIKAVQDAYAMGIGTFAIGIGDIVTNNSGCETRWARCGIDHLTDLANAGQGLPVAEPPPDLVYQQCVAGTQGGAGTLTATYSAVGGDAMPFTAMNRDQLHAGIQSTLSGVISCTLDMDAIVTGNPALGTVTITPENDVERPLTNNDQADGWVLEPNGYQVTLTGEACNDYKAGNADVHIVFPCNVAEPR